MAEGELSLEKCLQVCESLDTLLTKSFGPNALHCLLGTSTGRLIITSSGHFVLGSLHLSHPIGRLLVKSALSHHTESGDNTKTFILMVAEALRYIVEKNAKTSKGSFQRMNFIRAFSVIKNDILPNVVVPTLQEHFSQHTFGQVISLEEAKRRCSKIIYGSLQGNFNPQTQCHLCEISEKFVFDNCGKVEDIFPVLREIVDSFEYLCLDNPGQSIVSSSVVQGVIIQRDFIGVTAPVNNLKNVKFILVDYSLEDCCPSGIETVIKVKTSQEATDSFQWKHTRLKRLVDILSKGKVKIMLCTEIISELLSFLLAREGISSVQCVPKEDVDRLSSLASLPIVNEDCDFLDIEKYTEQVGCVSSIVVDGKRCVHLNGIGSKSPNVNVKNTIVLTAPSPGICDQVASALNCAFKTLLIAFDPHKQVFISNKENSPRSKQNKDVCTVCPGGGAFEMSFYLQMEKILKDGKNLDSSVRIGCEILKNALLAVPYRIQANSFAASKIKNRVNLMTFLKLNTYNCPECGTDFARGIEGKFGKESLADDRIMEPFSSKVSLLYAVLQCLEQILRLDHIVPVSQAIDRNTYSDEDDDLY